MNRDDWNRRYEGTELVWTARPNQFLVAEVEGLAPGRALNLAAGEGRNSVWLAAEGWQVTGVDFSDVALDKARRLAEANDVSVEWLQADLLEYNPPPRSFDLVTLLYLHLPQDQMRLVLERAAKAVAPGGVFLLIGHDITNIEDGHGGPQSPAVLYGPDDVTRSLGDLEIERAERVLRAVETKTGPVSAIDVLVRAVRG